MYSYIKILGLEIASKGFQNRLSTCFPVCFRPMIQADDLASSYNSNFSRNNPKMERNSSPKIKLSIFLGITVDHISWSNINYWFRIAFF